MSSSTTLALGAGGAHLVSHRELEQAWAAIRAGRFRHPERTTSEAWTGGGGVVVVAGCHGWSGASTAALLVAEGQARAGAAVRVLDAAAPARSGLAGAAVTEHGVDPLGRWRVGQRGLIEVHRVAGPVTHVVEVPVPGPESDTAVSVVDAGWPVPDLLACAEVGHWVGGVLRARPVVLTARATMPGLRHAEAALEALDGCAGPVTVLLVGARRVPSWVVGAAGPRVAGVHGAGRLVIAPECPGLAMTGVTPAPLPRVLAGVGSRLAQLTQQPTAAPGSSGPVEHPDTAREDTPMRKEPVR